MLLVGTPIIKSMASDFIYSPNSRLTKLRQNINRNTGYRAESWQRGKIQISSNALIGYMFYDTDLNTSTGFVLAIPRMEPIHAQEFKTLFPTCIRLFCTNGFRYYRIDATRIFHANKS